MNIPLDRLYHYIERLCEDAKSGSVIIYRFWPDGSKDFANLTNLHDRYAGLDLVINPYVFCHDQEPLNYAHYQEATLNSPEGLTFIKQLGRPKHNVRDYPCDIWDQALLLHSEQNSPEIALYESDGFVPVYYWSHAVIARDWFRYAQHVEPGRQASRRFLIYNRAWSGTREYRLKFAEMILQHDLLNHCQMTVSPIDQEAGQHYDYYQFKNPQWRPNTVLEKHFVTNTVASTYSADFDVSDYENCDIEVVLETLFDDRRWHLTEKILRPIALGQPFVAMATAGSLTYLRSYGFKTFADVWDESYDLEKDPQRRMQAVIDLMKQIASWSPEQRANKLCKANQIAQYNRQWFFSQAFFDQVIGELRQGLAQAFDHLHATNRSQEWLAVSQQLQNMTPWPKIYSPMLNLTDTQWQEATALALQYQNKNSIN